MRRQWWSVVSLIPWLALWGTASMGWAAEYPERPVNMIVPYGPGGAADLGSRVIAEKMEEFLGQRMVSIYKPGGAGSLGAAFVAKAKPDGYTVLVGSITPNIISPIVKKLDYGLDDFIAIGSYGSVPMWLVVRPDAPWKTLKDYVEEARRAPDKLTVGSYGTLSLADFGIQLLSKQAGIKVKHVPFKSTAEALTNLLGKNIDSAFVSGAGGLLESGSVRILAVAEEKRLDDLPDVATFSEFGYPIVLKAWYSFMLPKGIPQAAVDKLYMAQKKAFERYGDEITKALRRVEVRPFVRDPEETKRNFKKDYDLLYRVADELGMVAK